MLNAFSVKSFTIFLLLIFGLTWLSASTALAAFTLLAEANPDPVEPGQMMGVQVSVTTSDPTGELSLRMVWPEQLNSTPYITDGGACPGSCEAGEYLTWDLGNLGSSASVSVGFNEHLLNSAVIGSFIQLDFELLDGITEVATFSLAVEVQLDSPLELNVDPLTDPVVPGGTLVYEIVYGNAGASSAENTQLTFPLPSGTQFISTTGGGEFAAGSVSWDLGRLRANSGGRERVSVQVDALAEGSLLLVDAATLSGDIALQARQARATAVSRVATQGMQLALEINPERVEPDQLVDTQITVSNPGNSSTGVLSLRLLWPAELNSSPSVTQGSSCGGSCSTGEYATWDLGLLEAHSTIAIGINENVRGNALNGSLIPLVFELLEDGYPARNRSHTLIIEENSPLELAVDPLTDPVASAGTLVYEIVYGNAGDSSAEDSELIFPLPPGTQFSSATGAGAFAAGSVSWDLGRLRGNTSGRERVIVRVDALAEGSLLLVDSAILSGEVALQAKHARAMAVSRVATQGLQLNLEANPDRVEPNQLVDTQITVSNPDGSNTGMLTLRVLWPEELNSSPVVTRGGDCPGACSTGEYLTWDLGLIGAHSSIAVSFNESVRSNISSGALIPLEVELLEDGLPARNLSHTLDIQNDSPLELAIDPLFDPVASGGTLVYEIVYGNAGDSSAEDSELIFPLPPGTQFSSATGGGVFANGSVRWDLGRLRGNGGGRERVVVQVDALTEGSLLLVDAATLSGDVALQPKEARAMAVSRVATQGLQLELEANPDPVGDRQLTDTQITVSNPGANSTGSLVLRLLWPEELSTSPFITGGASCSPGCSPGEYVVWDLGELGPHTSMAVNINEELRSGIVNGTLIPLDVELIESGLPARNRSHTLIAQADSPLELSVDPLADPVASGETLVYEIVYGNAGASSAENTELTFPLPAGTQFSSATGGGVFADGSVRWNLGNLSANSGGRERVVVQVDALTDGSLLLVDAASLSGDVALQPRVARAMAVSRVATQGLQLELEVNPDPVGVRQLTDTQITVSNPGANSTGSLVLRLLWPEELSTSPFITGGASCSIACSPGEPVVWDLGELGPYSSMTVNINEELRTGIVNGTLIPLEVELLENGLPARNRSHTLIAQADSPLELAVDPLADPVVSGGTLVYEIVYGNAGASVAENTELTFPLPAGTQFSSATGGGVFANGSVRWNLGNLSANSGGRERVVVQVDALADGSLLLVDAATLSGDVDFLARQARAMAVSRVATKLLQLELTVNPNPVMVAEAVNAEITITNPTGNGTGTLSLRVLWPEELNSSPSVTGGGGCSGLCSAGEYLIWNLGVLGPGSNVTVNFSENIRNNIADGTIIPLEFELIEDTLPARNISKSLLVNPFTDHDQDGEPDIFDDDDDNDGMPDWWEILHGLDPLNDDDADDDPDGDGLTNLEEFETGGDPNVNNDLIMKDGFEDLS